MNVIKATPERSQIDLGKEELLILNAALNEITNGIDLFEFETRIGADRERVGLLLREMGALLDKMQSSHA